MTDFEFEKLLTDTLSTKFEPSEQLNKKIIEKMKNKPQFSYRRLGVVAAALVIVSGGIIAGFQGNFRYTNDKNVSPVAYKRMEKEIETEQIAVNAHSSGTPMADLEKSVATAEEMGHLGGPIPTFEEWITITQIEVTPEKAEFSLSELPDDVTPVYTVEKFENEEWNSYDTKIDIKHTKAEIYSKNGDFEIGTYRICVNSELGDTVYAEFEIN